MRLTIVTGGVVDPLRALVIVLQSVSKITSQTPISHAKEIASFIAFTSASSGPKGS